jgi:hypothetical protein
MLHTFTLIEFLELWRLQGGRCDYTGVPMTLMQKTEFQCSPERKDNKKGYVKDNVVLVILECNNRAQWDRSAIDYLKVISTKP